MVPLQTHGCYNACGRAAFGIHAVVPLQTHGCYNVRGYCDTLQGAVVPLQTHGCYNPLIAKTHLKHSRGSPTDSRVL